MLKTQNRDPEDNVWYRLATLFGRPFHFAIDPDGDLPKSLPKAEEIIARNRKAWNRYMAASLTEVERAEILKEQPLLSEDDLTPYSAEDLNILINDFSERSKSVKNAATLPDKPPYEINFSNLDFDSGFYVEGFIFVSHCNFHGSTFPDGHATGAWFDNATFGKTASFKNVTFACLSTTFNGTSFHTDADFENATFSGAYFRGTVFARAAFFYRATVRFAHFERAVFRGATNFMETRFFQGIFEKATFSGWVSFQDTIFSAHAHFKDSIFHSSISFVNAQMNGEASFEGTKFYSEPPRFHGAKIHEGSVWRGASWPLPKNVTEAGTFIDAYERLKFEMDRLKKHEDELNFFAHELQSRRIYHGMFRGFPIALYGLLSDYGRSYFRPLIWLLVIWVLGAVGLLTHFGLYHYPRAFGLSLVNTFGALGFRREFVDPSVTQKLSRALELVAGLQSISGIILLFLFGLGVRNRFRMR
ncbi:MAG: hypothetical protein QOF22_2362 [Bradyrhizobium sp.]|nr:hypothetical protein [Bradyrhizobium sp.]